MKAYIGLSGPIGYDYTESHARRGASHPPNAVLEDLVGLLLAYDEFIFLSRDFCPRPLWDMPGVSFVSDDSPCRRRAVTAIEQYQGIIDENGGLGWGDITGTFTRTIATITGTDGRIGIDNHSRRLHDLEEVEQSGNSARVDSIVLDFGIASSLETPVDVISNTVALESLSQQTVRNIGAHSPSKPMYTDWHIDVADEIGSALVPDSWPQDDRLVSSIFELREDPLIRDFRANLADRVPCSATTEAAESMQNEAFHLVGSALRRQMRGRHMYAAVAQGVAATAITTAIPFLGLPVAAVQEIGRIATAHRTKSSLGWAAFLATHQRY